VTIYLREENGIIIGYSDGDAQKQNKKRIKKFMENEVEKKKAEKFSNSSTVFFIIY